ncbi:MAG: hypothetical protein PF636_03905 [Actinomycetota bacterium]|nr:hypothetical protein [Actinomycetota bacterium]
MPTIRSIEGRRIVDRKGKSPGRVDHVLFHPQEPRVVGFQIQPDPILYFVDRRPRFIRLQALKITDQALTVAESVSAWGSSAEKEMGFSWETTVIWRNMTVHEIDGEDVGFVGDAEFRSSDGTLRGILLTRGLAEDAAAGTRQVPADRIQGFDGDNVLIERIRDIELEGGAAAAAGHGAAVAGAAAEKAARKAATTATVVGRVAVRVANESKTGRKAMGALRRFGKKALDAMSVDDEDK